MKSFKSFKLNSNKKSKYWTQFIKGVRKELEGKYLKDILRELEKDFNKLPISPVSESSTLMGGLIIGGGLISALVLGKYVKKKVIKVVDDMNDALYYNDIAEIVKNAVKLVILAKLVGYGLHYTLLIANGINDMTGINKSKLKDEINKFKDSL